MFGTAASLGSFQGLKNPAATTCFYCQFRSTKHVLPPRCHLIIALHHATLDFRHHYLFRRLICHAIAALIIVNAAAAKSYMLAVPSIAHRVEPASVC